jgi:DNA topoisomerase-1
MTIADGVQVARRAGLRYVNDNSPGIARKTRGGGFVYMNARRQRVRDRATLLRIQQLAIPPAWKDVWISPSSNGHIQAIGFDERGRKQYKYHTRWRAVRDESKYHRTIAFAKAVPTIRRKVARDLKLRGLPKAKVLAAIVKIMETSFMRVGNEEYARTNHSYGLTTIRNRHVKVRGSKVHFEFRGKSGVHREVDLEDARLAKIVRRCQELPEQELFEFIDDDGRRHDIKSGDVNAYLKEITDDDFTAKDFRTWAGTMLAALALQEFEAFDSQAQAKRNVVAAIESVAKRLGNTKAVCRKCYIHPAVIESYLDGDIARSLKRQAEQKLTGSLSKLRPQEAAVLALLQERLKHEVKNRKPPH